MSSASIFHPAKFLDSSETSEPAALVILNQPIRNMDLFTKSWNNSCLRVCADGGANRLHDALNNSSNDYQLKQYIPDAIIGDLDSLRDDVKHYYETLGVKIVHDPDQYSTDFMKATNMVKKLDESVAVIYAFGGMGGRVDQEFHSIHHLFLSKQQNQLLYIISEQSVTFLVPQGGPYEIHTPLNLFGKTCGIIPIVGPTEITTKGLEWDVTNWPTSFETQMSTSNHLTKDIISIKATKDVIFTVELRNYGG